jgi:hypothetical protein
MQRTGRPMAAPLPKPPAPAAGGAQLSAAQHDAIRRAFIEYLGPIGDLVYDEHRGANKPIDKLLADLASEIPDGRNAEQFLTQIRERLKTLG